MTTDIHTDLLVTWYRDHARALVQEFAAERVAELDRDADRIEALRPRRDESITACFLGMAAIGKSTLINALTAGAEHIVPSGGTGPLTALAIRVHAAASPSFVVRYHSPRLLWRLGFALEQHHRRSVGAAKDGDGFEAGVTAEDLAAVRAELEEPAVDDAPRGPSEKLRLFEQQARLLLTGNQDGEASLPQLLDGLYVALGKEPKWGTTPTPEQRARLERVHAALTRQEPYAREGAPGDREFLRELREHAAGFLAPIIAEIDVGWPSSLLERGLTLVDLPGVGIAGDVYEQQTRQWVRERARAIVLVVNRGGFNRECAQLLGEETGFLNRLLHAADDPAADPASLIVAVTHVDDLAETRYAQDSLKEEAEHLEDIRAEIVQNIREQVRKHLLDLPRSSDATTKRGQAEVIERLVADLRVHPVSAPQFAKLLRGRGSFLSDAAQSGVPGLAEDLAGLADAWRERLAAQEAEIAQGLHESLSALLERIRAQWEERTHAAEEAERLRGELERFVPPLRQELAARQGAFQEFLSSTLNARIQELVRSALFAAQEDMRAYVDQFNDAGYWTLKKAVLEGGTWFGARNVDLPNQFTRICEAPLAAIWGEQILSELRKRTRDLAQQYARLVGQLAEWALEHGAHVQADLVRAQRNEIQAEARRLERVGRELVDELREKVRAELHDVIRRPIARRCQRFVDDNQHVNAGVKRRILDLFWELTGEVARAAEGPATQKLREQFAEVEAEIRQRFESMQDPIAAAMDAIVASHETRQRRSDAQIRRRVLEKVGLALAKRPPLPVSARAERPVMAGEAVA